MIPKRCIQGWIGPSPMPEKVVKWCKEMQSMNRDFEYLFLGNDALQKYGRDPYINHMVSRGEPWAFVMDRIRVLALKEHGGIWIDPDAQPVKPLNTLKVWGDDRWDFLTAHRDPYRPGVHLNRGISLVDNTVMGSAKNGRVINRLINLNDSRSPRRTGAEYGKELMRISSGDVFWEESDVFYSMGPNAKAVIRHDEHNLASWTTKPNL